MSVCVAVLGLGEAGSEIARDLVDAGVVVQGYDPVRPAPSGVQVRPSEAAAVAGAQLVLSVNSAADAAVALRNGAPAAHRAVWADLNTGDARLKRDLAAALAATSRTSVFADVALMSPVPGSGLRTPMLASGPGARRLAEALTPLGAGITIVDGGPGEAATRKLLRSVFFKGLAAAVVEALAAAKVAGLEPWLRDNIGDELARADRTTVERLVSGSAEHAVRRSHEMAAAAELLTDLGVEPRIARASHDLLVELAHPTHAKEQTV
ncbi:3-hydroxyisobutyrate dehydrogenase [Promicromonospora umidemergens]|uniref:Phosphogluconate dehydrogenase NAD-binding putative C-terminal domain-containing protein n=1 Tax=Promicromonospora umidemergens TaxID=629679 RepID=A0ABP8X9Z0_9MICO|nr:NAD(P)-dependent oxidoreductase [Promicromonospora umidemergens]MCP2281509.1 3-hydroxyisobutyrate dehydrogenase [Promicromonospora umidemergens]